MKQLHNWLRKAGLATLTLLILAGSTFVQAQTVTGTVQGMVRDASGGVLQNAEVKARNIDTGAELTTTTNSEGLYRFPSVLPGRYNFAVSAQGFRRNEITDVTVNVGVVITVDAAMQIGSVAEVVNVSAEQTVLETETAQISNNFTSKQLQSLPVNSGGGGIDTLALLSPGVVGGMAGGFGNTNGTTIFSNGGRSRANNFNIDGQDNNDLSVTGPQTFINNQDAVGEFQIITNGFSAEYGQASGSVVNILTKNGTNQFHGTAAYFYRNRKLFDTRTNLERRDPNSKEAPPLTNQTFSYTIGGPIVVDKLHFFNSYLGQREPGQSLAQSGPNGLTPTPAGIQTLLAIPGLNPATAATIRNLAPFNVNVGNPVIQPRVDPRLVPVTVGGVTTNVEFAAIQRQVSSPFSENQFQTRIDWDMNDKSRIFGTHLYQKQVDSASTGNLGLTNGFFGDVPSISNRFGVTHLYTFNARMVNEFRFSYGDIDLLFGGNMLAEATEADQDVPSLLFPAGFLSWGTPNNLPQARLNRNFQYVDNFSWTLGNHSLKMGLDFRHRKADLIFLPNVNGTYSFLNDANSGVNGLSFFAQNNPTQASLTLGPIGSKLSDFQQYYFFQDDWKLRRNLTLNLGVRYENFGQPINTLNKTTLERESNPDTAFYNTSVPLESRIVPFSPVDKDNFAPRIGFAYSPGFSEGLLKKLTGGDNTVVRGGFAIAYDLAFYNILLNMQTAAPVVLAATLPRGSNVILPSDPNGPAVRQLLQPLVPLRTVDPRTLNQTTISSDFHSPYTMQWSLGVQRQIGRHHGVEVGYVATRSLQQFRTINANPRIDALFRDFPNLLPSGLTPVPANHPVTISRGRIFPGQGLIRQRDNGAVAEFHSMQTQYTARFSSFTSTVNYTLAKQTDTGTDVFGTTVGQTIAQNPFDLNSGEKARGFLDFRNNLSLSVVYEVPAFKDQKGFLGHVLGGWQFSGTYRALSGQPYAAQQGNFGSPYNDAPFGTAFIVPDGGLRPFRGNVNVDPQLVALDDVTARARFATLFTSSTPAAQYYLLNDLNKNRVTPVTPNDVRFIVNTQETARRFGTPWGNEPRNTLLGDNLRLGNFSLFKNTKLTRGFYRDSAPITLQFRFDMFNAFNNTNLGVGNFSVDNAGNGFADPTENSTGDTLTGRRRLNFGLKVIF
jgi:carboxypeptidase family protein/TonB-dependent receptor-like protein